MLNLIRIHVFVWQQAWITTSPSPILQGSQVEGMIHPGREFDPSARGNGYIEFSSTANLHYLLWMQIDPTIKIGVSKSIKIFHKILFILFGNHTFRMR